MAAIGSKRRVFKEGRGDAGKWVLLTSGPLRSLRSWRRYGTLKGTEVQTKLRAKDEAMMGALRVEQQLLREWLKSLDKSLQDLEQMTPAKK
jgi:hypothetical protein